MPDREMPPFNVYETQDGHIAISQQFYGEDVRMIIFHPYQIETLIKLLKEVTVLPF